MTATFRSQPELDATWQTVQAQAAEARETGADVNRLIERDAEAHNARALAIREARQAVVKISAGTVRAARHEKFYATIHLIEMARQVAELIGESNFHRVADWIDARADLSQPRTAGELAAQWREQREAR